MEKFETSNFDTHIQELEFLRQLGFPVSKEITTANSAEEIWQRAEIFQNHKDKLGYHTDGMVVKLNDNRLAKNLGVVGKTPRSWCALKFPPEEVATIINQITWQVGRTGKITPVAELAEVQLMGTTVKRATLHNYKEFVEKKLMPNDTIIIRKAGEIIPEIVQVLYNLRDDCQTDEPFSAPDNCPVCQTKLNFSKTKIDLICPNITCPAQILGRLSYFSQRNIGNIVGLSEKQIEKFIEIFGINDIPDLFNLPYDEIKKMEDFGDKSVENLSQSIKQAQQIEDFRFLAGLGIEGIGLEVAKLICKKLTEKSNQE